MNIESFTLPLSRPLSTAAGTIEERRGFLVRIDADETPRSSEAWPGGPGIGEATPLPGWTESRKACRDALDRAAEVIEVDGSDAVLDELDGSPAARHGVSLALADANARTRGVPLYQVLGTHTTVEHVPVNATIGDGTPEGTAREAAAAVERGFDCLKVKVGARPLEGDAERIRAVRAAVGKEPQLRLDANGAWSRAEAERALRTFAAFDVEYVEQPLSADDLDGLANLRDRNGTGGQGEDELPRIAIDESIAEVGIDDVLCRNVADVVILKPMVLGGPDRTIEAAQQANRAGVEPVVTTTVDAVYARTAAVHVAASIQAGLASDCEVSLACGLATADRLVEDLAPDPAPVEDGRIRVPQNPGLGVDPDA